MRRVRLGCQRHRDEVERLPGSVETPLETLRPGDLSKRLKPSIGVDGGVVQQRGEPALRLRRIGVVPQLVETRWRGSGTVTTEQRRGYLRTA